MMNFSLELMSFEFKGSTLTKESAEKLSSLSANNKILVIMQMKKEFELMFAKSVRTLALLKAIGVSTDNMEEAMDCVDAAGPELFANASRCLKDIARDAINELPTADKDLIDWATKRGSN